MTFQEKLERFAALVAEQQLKELTRNNLTCEANTLSAGTRIKPGRKYTKIDSGSDLTQWIGRFMVENETGEIYGIKAYGVIHRGHHYGNLDTIDNFYWGDHTVLRRFEPVAQPATQTTTN